MADTIHFTGFTPSVDPTTPGAIIDCMNMVPTMRGMKAAASMKPFGNPVFDKRITGAANCELLTGAYRTFAGTATDLWEVTGTTNDNVSETAGAYTGGANKWRFAQFGNASLATNKSQKIQQSILAGKFSTIAGAPVADIIETVQGFVFAFGTNDPTYGDNPHGWWCSALYDQTNWVPSQATQCARGVIVDAAGPITAGRALGANMVVYKRQSMFYGSYQGPPVIWAFQPISPIVGTPSQECVVSIGTMHIFLGSDFQVYSFDGTRPVPIGKEVNLWLRENWSDMYQDIVESYKDVRTGLIYWYICSKSNASGIPDLCLVYNYFTGKFGRADNNVEAACQAVTGQITWDGMGALPGVTTWDTLPAIPYNSSYWSQSSLVGAVFDPNHQMQSLTGASISSSLTTGYFGDDSDFTYIQGILPRFRVAPETCSGQATLVKILGTQPTFVQLPEWYDGEIACDFSTRWCSITLRMTGDHEILGAMPRLLSAGAI